MNTGLHRIELPSTCWFDCLKKGCERRNERWMTDTLSVEIMHFYSYPNRSQNVYIFFRKGRHHSLATKIRHSNKVQSKCISVCVCTYYMRLSSHQIRGLSHSRWSRCAPSPNILSAQIPYVAWKYSSMRTYTLRRMRCTWYSFCPLTWPPQICANQKCNWRTCEKLDRRAPFKTKQREIKTGLQGWCNVHMFEWMGWIFIGVIL